MIDNNIINLYINIYLFSKKKEKEKLFKIKCYNK